MLSDRKARVDKYMSTTVVFTCHLYNMQPIARIPMACLIYTCRGSRRDMNLSLDCILYLLNCIYIVDINITLAF